MSRFPDNCHFAFTVVDDTDGCSLANIQPVYQLLADCGIRTTKTIWALPNVSGAPFPGSTLQDPDYCAFILDLLEKGFEVGLHNVRNAHSTRAVIELGIQECLNKIGIVPRVQVNHLDNHENIYWGPARFTTFPSRQIYRALSSFCGNDAYAGHVKTSPYFWGDICRKHFTYVRSFVFGELNLDKVSPTLPYSNPAQPFVNYWFTSSLGNNVETFCRTLSAANQDRLEDEAGVCIMYTHFASGFVEDGRLNPEFAALIRRLAKKKGWFVPVSTLLDHLRKARTDNRISFAELRSLESRWLKFRVMHRSPRQ